MVKKKLLTHRNVIILGLIIALLVTYFLNSNKPSSFLENLFCTFLGSFITITIIDFLVNKDKERLVKQINSKVSFILAYRMYKIFEEIMTHFNFKQLQEYKGHLPEVVNHKEVINIINEFRKNKDKLRYYEKLNEISFESIDKMNRIVSILKKSMTDLSKLLENIKPFLDPRVSEIIFNVNVEIGGIESHRVFLDSKLQQFLDDGTDESIDKFPIMWQILVEEIKKSEDKIEGLFLEVLEKAIENDLHSNF